MRTSRGSPSGQAISQHRKAQRVDVTLILEGTYPYVSGGVSAWVDQLLAGFPRLSFAIVFLGGRSADYGAAKYALPDNVTHFQVHFLHDALPPAMRMASGDDRPGAATMSHVSAMHDALRDPQHRATAAAGLISLAARIDTSRSPATDRLTFDAFLHGEPAWSYLREQFEQQSTDPSFVDYFWTVRSMHAPIFRLAAIRDGLPETSVFHCASTGFAGLLGAMAKARYARPLVISEHGLYTNERRIELLAARWIADNRERFERDPIRHGYFRELWMRFFESIGRAAYQAADTVIALFESNRMRAIAEGAPSARIRTIANGVDVARFAGSRAVRPQAPPPVVCLAGRVAPIKDVKTFIRAMRTVVNRLPNAEGWIAGPLDEDPAYVDECAGLIETLGLTDTVKLLGPQEMVVLLPRVGVLALSSISEALPIAILEGFAAGVPAVCTDVGACRILIEGDTAEDRAIGGAGAVVGIGDAQALGERALALLTDPVAWRSASQAGWQRVSTFYTEASMLSGYRMVYQRMLRASIASDGSADTLKDM